MCIESQIELGNQRNNIKRSEVSLYINRFQPIIKKYSRKLNYEEAESDLIIFLLQLLKKVPKFDSEKFLNSYIAKSIKNEYIRLNKKQQLINQKEILMEINNFKHLTTSNVDIDLNIDIKNALKILSKRQRSVIHYKIFLGYSDSKTADILNVSRQAIFKTQKKALELLKKQLKTTT
ncbi:sigma-70 family RNA polymerase sigma factor [Desulforamulus ruminis]|uniref:sigma-70 family RNA polymerase sigma factor n=1 Tax=Desulforamulus ruminis TaxID=1564 RepID=UPI002FD91C11